MVTRSQLAQRHAAEAHALQRKYKAQLKRTKDRDDKRALKAKQAEDMEKMKQRHQEEMKALQEGTSEDNVSNTDVLASSSSPSPGSDVRESNNNNNNINNNDDDHNENRRKQREKRQKKKARRAARKEAAREVARSQETAKEAARALEEERLHVLLTKAGLRRYPIAGDGHCMYRALGHQLQEQGHETVAGISGEGLVKRVREMTAQYMRLHADEFRPFLPSEASTTTTDDDNYEKYCDQVANSSAWGGHIEMRALSMALGMPIYVYLSDQEHPLCISPSDSNDTNTADEDVRCLRLVYLQHAYGLGEHYDSVEPAR